MVTDGATIRAVINTFVFALSSVVTHIGLGMLLALGVHRTMTRGTKYFVRTAYFFPFLVSWAAVALIWKYVLDPAFGLANYYLSTTTNWLASPTWALPTLSVVGWWHTIGYTFVIMLAGLQTVPGELVEAARTDGASSWRVLWHVTIPMMSPTIFFASVITFIGAFQIFDPMQIITPGGGPDDSTMSVVMYLWERGFQRFAVGYASAVAILMLVVMMTVTLIQFRGARRWVHQA